MHNLMRKIQMNSIEYVYIAVDFITLTDNAFSQVV